MRPARFGMDLHPMPMSAFAHQFEMIIHRQIANGAAKVVKESIAYGTRIDHPPRDDWNEREQIISATSLKFLAQGRSPIEHFNLPTIGVQIFERFSGQRSGVGNQRFDNFLPIKIEGSRINWIEGIATPIIAAR